MPGVSVWQEFNNNPTGRRGVGDCAVRAVSLALDTTWEDAYAKLAVAGFGMGDLPNSNTVANAVLRQNGFYNHIVPNDCPNCYTFREFAIDHPNGTYFLGTGTHVATVIDGKLFDAWNSEDEIVAYFWSKNPEE